MNGSMSKRGFSRRAGLERSGRSQEGLPYQRSLLRPIDERASTKLDVESPTTHLRGYGSQGVRYRSHLSFPLTVRVVRTVGVAVVGGGLQSTVALEDTSDANSILNIHSVRDNTN